MLTIAFVIRPTFPYFRKTSGHSRNDAGSFPV